MIKRLLRGFVFGVCLFSLCAQAGAVVIKSTHASVARSFSDNTQLDVVLSNVDVNRLYVINDKITAIHGPSDVYRAKQDNSGSIYVTLSAHEPFTLYISTAAGHHFSLWITPKAVVGKTLSFFPNMPSEGTLAWEKNSVYQKLLVNLIKGMINQKAPEGYAATRVAASKQRILYRTLRLTPVAVYRGAHLEGLVYQIQNRRRTPITLSPTLFFQPHVRALALSKQTLLGNGQGYLYEVISRGMGS